MLVEPPSHFESPSRENQSDCEFSPASSSLESHQPAWKEQIQKPTSEAPWPQLEAKFAYQGTKLVQNQNR